MPAPARRRWVLLVAVLLALTTAAPAAAHTELVSSDPADGQSLSEPPDELTLRFGEDLLPAGAELVAKDASGARVDLGQPEVDGATLSASWPAEAAGGDYTVAYRAVAGDGHPLEGTFGFRITEPEQPEAAPAVSASPATAPQPADPDSGGTPNLAIPVLFVAALLAVGFFVWRSRAD